MDKSKYNDIHDLRLVLNVCLASLNQFYSKSTDPKDFLLLCYQRIYFCFKKKKSNRNSYRRDEIFINQ